MTDWGTYGGRRRKPCPEDPRALLGQPIGMYHCPVCGMMQLAGMEHGEPWSDYEDASGQPWPPGYEPVVIICACGVPQQHIRALLEHWREEHGWDRPVACESTGIARGNA